MRPGKAHLPGLLLNAARSAGKTEDAIVRIGPVDRVVSG